MPSYLSMFERIGFREMLLIPLIIVALLVGCESKSPTEEAKKTEKPEAGVSTEQTVNEPKDMKPGEAINIEASPLSAPVSSSGEQANTEGVVHAGQGHWDVAEDHFRKAVEADPKLAEAHFNLGLALDKLDRHDEAKAAFEKAVELAPNNSMITNSPVLRKHLST